MQQIIYISKATSHFSPEDLIALQKHSADKNSIRSITGLLLFRQNYFCQLIEGPPTHIQALYANIRHDPRHHEVTTLLDRNIIKRAFPKWDMLLMNMDFSEQFEAFSPIAACQSLTKRYADVPDDPQWALDLLLAFISPFPLQDH